MALMLNDPEQYDRLADQWWAPQGQFAMLHWIAAARARLIPEASRSDALLVDLGCGGGLMAPHVAALSYRHVGVDLNEPALTCAREHGVETMLSDAARVDLPDSCADVVLAGEILEHVDDPFALVDEACRLLKPGGTVVIDTIANTWAARIVAIEIAERIKGLAPRGIHDPRLFIDRQKLIAQFRHNDVDLQLHGLRPSMIDLALWLAHRRPHVRMLTTPSTAILFQARGVKRVDQ